MRQIQTIQINGRNANKHIAFLVLLAHSNVYDDKRKSDFKWGYNTLEDSLFSLFFMTTLKDSPLFWAFIHKWQEWMFFTRLKKNQLLSRHWARHVASLLRSNISRHFRGHYTRNTMNTSNGFQLCKQAWCLRTLPQLKKSIWSHLVSSPSRTVETYFWNDQPPRKRCGQVL